MMADLGPDRAVLAETASAAAATPEYHIRRGSRGSAVSQGVEAPPASVVEWNEQAWRPPRYLASVDELRAEIQRVAVVPASPGGGIGLGLSSIGGGGSSPLLGGDGAATAAAGTSSRRRLFLLHGLPEAHVKALRSSLEIDPAFIEAHAARRRYRPLRWRQQARFAHYEYPELVTRGGGGGSSTPGPAIAGRSAGAAATNAAASASANANAAAARRRRPTEERVSSTLDLMDDPTVQPIAADADGLAAVFCRCSLWMSPQADVLFLDRPIWRDPSSPLRKARRLQSVTRPFSQRPRSSGGQSPNANVWDVALAEGDEISSLEDVLQETLKDAAAVGEDLQDILSRLAYDHWIELFEVLGPHAQPSSHETLHLYWGMTQALEQNADMVSYASRQGGRLLEASPAHWQGLLTRTQRRVELLKVIVPPRVPFKAQPSNTSSNNAAKKPSRQGTYGSNPQLLPAQPKPAAPSVEDEKERSLNRVAYMGGILIPVSIVSGILSMGDRFGPDGDQFWIFWTVATPFVVMAILIIYVDIIRKAEVLVEVSLDAVMAAADDGPRLRVETVQEKTERVTFEEMLPSEAETAAAIANANAALADAEANAKSRRTLRRRPRRGIAGHVVTATAPIATETTTTTTTYTVADEERIIDMPTNRARPRARRHGESSDPTPLSPGAEAAADDDDDDDTGDADTDDGDNATADFSDAPATPASAPGTLPLPNKENEVIIVKGKDGDKAFQLRQLGVAGAIKALVGLARPKRAADLPKDDSVDIVTFFQQRKTRTT